jgi:hypothetical protein
MNYWMREFLELLFTLLHSSQFFSSQHQYLSIAKLSPPLVFVQCIEVQFFRMGGFQEVVQLIMRRAVTCQHLLTSFPAC